MEQETAGYDVRVRDDAVYRVVYGVRAAGFRSLKRQASKPSYTSVEVCCGLGLTPYLLAC